MHAPGSSRRGCRAGAALVLLVVGAALVPGAARASNDRWTKVFGSVAYAKRDCELSETSALVPLPGAKLELDRALTAPVITTLSATGTFKTSIGGRGPIHAFVILDGPRIEVAPKTVGKAAYRLKLGVLTAGRNDSVEIRADLPAGAANIWTVLNQGASVAAKVSPVTVPKVTARWRDDADLQPSMIDLSPGTAYWRGTRSIFLDGQGAHSDQWETWVILHEYGHHLLRAVADPQSPGGNHKAGQVWPDKQELAWSEGFADAFPTIVTGDPNMSRACIEQLDLDATPATPLPDDPRLAQYNEVAIAGVVWKVSQHFGNGDAQLGLKRLLAALHTFRYDGHPPHSLREVRDALITGGLEQDSPDEHTAIDGIFAAENIGWGQDVQVAFDDSRDEGARAHMKIHLVLTGPYGTCQVTGDDVNPPPQPLVGSQDWWYGDIGVEGGLQYTWQDECLVSGGNADPSEDQGILNSLLWLKFPYLAGEEHLSGNFTLTAQYVCSDDTPLGKPPEPDMCTPDRKVDVIVTSGLADPVEEDGIDLQQGADTKILYFNATGNVCTVYPNNQICRT